MIHLPNGPAPYRHVPEPCRYVNVAQRHCNFALRVNVPYAERPLERLIG